MALELAISRYSPEDCRNSQTRWRRKGDLNSRDPSTFNKWDSARLRLSPKEELVAEFGAAYLCAEAGISNEVIHNQARYIAGWLKNGELAITSVISRNS
jgi:antirestriction protein ArdC